MKTDLPTPTTPTMTRAAELLKACVHCGFCTATCPSYQILGDELDSPRGRIYLIKEMIERQEASALTREHLDRCLLCRNCETTCPSGVQYGELLALGRHEVLRFAPRAWGSRLLRASLIAVLSRRKLFAVLLRIGQFFRPVLPRALAAQIPRRERVGAFPRPVAPSTGAAKPQLILFEGCAQPALRPAISVASAQVLAAAGYEVLRLPALGCCGAIAHHLEADAQATIKRTIDVLMPYLDAGAAGVVFDASGCGVMLKDYGHLLRDDPLYAAKAARVAAACDDISVWVLPHLASLQSQIKAQIKTQIKAAVLPKLAYHPPCTLQHGLKQKDGVLTILRGLGFRVALPDESHLCCGSAGTYSILQPTISAALRARKVGHLETALTDAADGAPSGTIVSANIGCIHHLQAGTARPVQHWVEVVAAQLTAS